jgi:hypothetical protein
MPDDGRRRLTVVNAWWVIYLDWRWRLVDDDIGHLVFLLLGCISTGLARSYSQGGGRLA